MAENKKHPCSCGHDKDDLALTSGAPTVVETHFTDSFIDIKVHVERDRAELSDVVSAAKDMFMFAFAKAAKEKEKRGYE